jgi:DNA polymerase elongation subunit (family B)
MLFHGRITTMFRIDPQSTRSRASNRFESHSTRTNVDLDRTDVQSKFTRLISNTSDSLSNSADEFRSSLSDRTHTQHQCQYLTVLSFELFCHTNETYAFSLDNDDICSIFYTIARETTAGWQMHSYVLISTHRLRYVQWQQLQRSFRSSNTTTITFVSTELELIERFSQCIEQTDPDMLLCYDMKLALYYLIKRAKLKYNLDLLVRLSRLPEQHETMTRTRRHMDADGSDLPAIVGRILLDLWKILRNEITLNIYTFDNAVYHVLHERVPHYSLNVISKWLTNDEGRIYHRTHLFNHERKEKRKTLGISRHVFIVWLEQFSYIIGLRLDTFNRQYSFNQRIRSY